MTEPGTLDMKTIAELAIELEVARANHADAKDKVIFALGKEKGSAAAEEAAYKAFIEAVKAMRPEAIKP